MKERVEVILSNLPIILVCPHGLDDTNTGHLTKACADNIGCNAVINWGFQRSDEVDVLKDLADCNRIDHIEEDVVREEFLEPIVRIRNRLSILKKSPYVYVYYIHGFGSQFDKQPSGPVDLILGYGEADFIPSYTCPIWMVDMMIAEWETLNGPVYCGKGGGKYSARNINNVCQMFSRHFKDSFVRSMQIEVCQRLRKTKQDAIWTGLSLADPILNIAKEGYFDTFMDRKYI